MFWGAGCDREFRVHSGTEGRRGTLGQGFVVQGTQECPVQHCREHWGELGGSGVCWEGLEEH